MLRLYVMGNYCLCQRVKPEVFNTPGDYTVGMGGAEMQAYCIYIVYLCVPVCVIEGGGASSTPA